jgi:hypothetical protein
MKKLLFIIVILGVVSCEEKGSDKRTFYFPKKELKDERVPQKQRVWVFILAGQSNMAGRGLVEPQDTIPNQRVLTINQNNEIILAKEPLHFYEKSMTGLDCGLSFGKTIVNHIPDSISILLIPTAVGGSSISQWIGDSLHRNVKLLTNFKERVKIAEKFGIIKGILWHQGENDANKTDLPDYKNRLVELFLKFREIVNNKELPIIIGELGAYSNDQYWLKINDQINLYSLIDSNSIVISTNDLKDKGDKVHFNSEGQRLLGQRFANGYINKITCP